MPEDAKTNWRPQPDPVLEELLEQARGRDAGRRKTALKAMLQMGPAGIEALLQLLYAETRRRQTLKTIFSVLAWLLLAFSLLLLPGILLSICTNTLMQTTLFAACIWLITYFLFIMRSRLPLTARQKDIMPIVTEINDVRAIGPIIDILSSKSRYDPDLLKPPLTRLLLQVRSSDAHLLNPGNRAGLYHQLDDLKHSHDKENIAFILAILRALEQVGDATALPYVGQLAHKLPPPAKEVQEAALRCLEFLQLRGGAQNVRQTYLRASDKMSARPDELLRAAQNSVEVHSDELLRPEATGEISEIGEAKNAKDQMDNKAIEE